MTSIKRALEGNDRRLSVGLLLLTMLIWGGTYVVVTKAGVQELPLLRFGVASLILVPLALLRGGIATLARPIPWCTLVLMGLTGVGLHSISR